MCVCVCVCVLHVSVLLPLSLLHDSVNSDLSSSRSLAVLYTHMSCPSLVYMWLRWKASTSESFKPTNTHRHNNYKCIVSWAYWEHHGFARHHFQCCQTEWEMCRSLSSSVDTFGDILCRRLRLLLAHCWKDFITVKWCDFLNLPDCTCCSFIEPLSAYPHYWWLFIKKCHWVNMLWNHQ